MKSDQVADLLRQRLSRKGLVPDKVLYGVSDAALIISYVTCSCCGQRIASAVSLSRPIGNARSLDDFDSFVDAALLAHE